MLKIRFDFLSAEPHKFLIANDFLVALTNVERIFRPFVGFDPYILEPRKEKLLLLVSSYNL